MKFSGQVSILKIFMLVVSCSKQWVSEIGSATPCNSDFCAAPQEERVGLVLFLARIFQFQMCLAEIRVGLGLLQGTLNGGSPARTFNSDRAARRAALS